MSFSEGMVLKEIPVLKEAEGGFNSHLSNLEYMF